MVGISGPTTKTLWVLPGKTFPDDKGIRRAHSFDKLSFTKAVKRSAAAD